VDAVMPSWLVDRDNIIPRLVVRFMTPDAVMSS
jgi:hypothetical protein